MASGWALIGLIVGAALTFAFQFALELIRDARKSEQLSHAIAGEISAVIGIVDARRYIPMIQQHAEIARQGQVFILKIQVEQTYFSVIEANLQNIGLLPVELPLLIPRFLTLSKSALEDFSSLGAGKWDQLPPQEVANLYDALGQVTQAAMITGREIVTLVASLYGSPHGRYPIGLRMRRVFTKRLETADRGE